MNINNKFDLLSATVEELEAFVLSLGEPRYRALQIFEQLHKGIEPHAMTNLSKALREKLAEHAICHFPVVEQKLVSQIDGTVKYVFSL